MPDPFNYTIASPMDAFQKSYAFGQAMSQQDAERAKQEAAQQRAQQVQTALQSIATDRSPDNIARNLLLFPELKEQITASESVLGEAERKNANSLRAEVISLYRGGNPTAARARLETQAQAYANTPGKEKEAQAAQTLLKSFDLNPDAVLLPMSIQLAQSDEKLYKNLFENSEMTAFQKDLMAAGIDPRSPEGIAKAKQFADLKVDPIVEMDTPQGTKFIGRESVYFQRFGSNAPKPAVKSAPSVGEVKGGYRFNGGDPANSANWSKVKGGGGSDATEGFR